jgi:hypothetical protein
MYGRAPDYGSYPGAPPGMGKLNLKVPNTRSIMTDQLQRLLQGWPRRELLLPQACSRTITSNLVAPAASRPISNHPRTCPTSTSPRPSFAWVPLAPQSLLPPIWVVNEDQTARGDARAWDHLVWMTDATMAAMP